MSSVCRLNWRQMSQHVYISYGSNGDDVGPTLKQHRVNVCSISHSPEITIVYKESRQRNPRCNIFYVEEFCSFEQVVSYLYFLIFSKHSKTLHKGHITIMFCDYWVERRPASTRCWTSAGLMLCQRRRLWASIGPALGHPRVCWECWQVFRTKTE